MRFWKMLLAPLVLLMSQQVAAKTYPALHLVELFTSQGCSSCPPADDWLHSLASHPDQFKSFVTVEFHVDYWDYLGWKDQFSQSIFSKRQRQYAREKQLPSVATPTVVLNGGPYQQWRKKTQLELTPPALAGIDLVKKNGFVEVKWQPPAGLKDSIRVWFAPLSGRQTAKISKGENAGRTLRHHHAALALMAGSMSFDQKSKRYRGRVALPTTRDPRTKAFALWLSPTNSLKPIVATGGRY